MLAKGSFPAYLSTLSSVSDGCNSSLTHSPQFYLASRQRVGFMRYRQEKTIRAKSHT